MIGQPNTSGFEEVKHCKVRTALLHDMRLLSVISILLLNLLFEGLETSQNLKIVQVGRVF